MDRLNISKEGGTVTFGQLYGMHDHITLALGEWKIKTQHTYKLCVVCMYYPLLHGYITMLLILIPSTNR